MFKLKRLLGLTGLTGLLAAFAFAVPAQASIKAECAVNGDAKTVDKDDPAFGVRLVGGQGKFTFEAIQIVCVGDSNKDGIPETDTFLASAEGWFDNTVCGTGKALGTVTAVEGGNPKAQLIVDKKFAVQFVGAQGVFKWHDSDKPLPLEKDDPESPDKEDNPEKSYDAAGDIHLGPPITKPPHVGPTGDCTKAFSATGTVLVHFDD